MRVESSVTAISWIPSEAVEGLSKLPFELGIARYDDPPPDRIEDLEALRAADAFRAANSLKAWIEVDEEGAIAGHGQDGGGALCALRLKVGATATAPAAELPLLRREPEVGDGSVRFVQSAGGRMGLPTPRRTLRKPFFQIASAPVWTTLELVLHASGEARGSLIGASPYPRHWVYDAGGRLVQKSATIDFESWQRDVHDDTTPWGERDAPTFATAAESDLERQLSAAVMSGGAKLRRRRLEPGETLVEEGERGTDQFLLLDGVLDVVVGGAVVAHEGPGAVLGERAALEAGRRTATLRAVTACRVVVIPAGEISRESLAALAELHRREEA